MGRFFFSLFGWDGSLVTASSLGFDGFDFSFKMELTCLRLPSAVGVVPLVGATVTPAFSNRSFRARFLSFRES